MSPADKNNTMKSTIKIDYDRGHNEVLPAVKIILPLNLHEQENVLEAHDIDSRDKLIADFLHTPGNQECNHIFKVNQCRLLEHGTHLLTTIIPVKEEELFEEFKSNIMGRIISEPDLQSYDTPSCKPCGFTYDAWVKIKEFFEWLEKQPYHGNIH